MTGREITSLLLRKPTDTVGSNGLGWIIPEQFSYSAVYIRSKGNLKLLSKEEVTSGSKIWFPCLCSVFSPGLWE